MNAEDMLDDLRDLVLDEAQAAAWPAWSGADPHAGGDRSWERAVERATPADLIARLRALRPRPGVQALRLEEMEVAPGNRSLRLVPPRSAEEALAIGLTALKLWGQMRGTPDATVSVDLGRVSTTAPVALQ